MRLFSSSPAPPHGEREAVGRSVLMWEMERRGGCRIASYGGGVGNCRADVALKVDRIMLRFRPIAPKPAAPPPPPVAAGAAVKGMTAGRARRKASGGGVRECRRGRRARNIVGGAFKEEERKRRSPSSSVWSGSMVTLPLMPETPEGKAAVQPMEVPVVPDVIPAWLRVRGGGAGGGGGGEVVTSQPVRPVGSWVTVECVTDTWDAPGGGDEVIRAALEAEDACPGFITDAWDRVIWTNEAYQRMVVGAAAEDGKEEVSVALVTKGMMRCVTCRAFTCRVVVRYANLRRGRGSLTAPCDVWRLDDGGYAWRVDIKAALSLSLGA